jgi:hypothetical protein
LCLTNGHHHHHQSPHENGQTTLDN